MDEDKNWGTPVDKSSAIGVCLKLVETINGEIEKLLQTLLTHMRIFELNPAAVAEIKAGIEQINTFAVEFNMAHEGLLKGELVVGTTEEDIRKSAKAIRSMLSIVEKKLTKFMKQPLNNTSYYF